MRNAKSVFCVVLSAALVFLSTVGVAAGDGRRWFQRATTTDAYVFPVTPEKTPVRWAAMNSDSQRAVSQVPEDVLAKMSTEGLIETCLSAPTLDGSLEGLWLQLTPTLSRFEVVYTDLSGASVLAQRADAGEKLMRLYADVDLRRVRKTDKWGSMRLALLEYMLLQEDVFARYTLAQRKELLRISARHALAMANRHAGEFSVQYTVLVAARILQVDSEAFRALADESPILQHYLETGDLAYMLTEGPIEKVFDETKGEWIYIGLPTPEEKELALKEFRELLDKMTKILEEEVKKG